MEDAFIFNFLYGTKHFLLRVSVDEIFSNREYLFELGTRLIQRHKIPIKYWRDLCVELLNFLKNQSSKMQDEESEKKLSRPINAATIIHFWKRSFAEGHLEFSKMELISNETIFSDVYHSLIHSKFIDYLLELEHSYALTVSTLFVHRDETIAKVEEQCREEMEDALLNIGVKYSDHHVNQLAKKQIEMTEMESSRWTSEICSLKEKQKRQYVDKVMKLYERLQIEHTSGNDSSKLVDQNDVFRKPSEIAKSTGYTRREESFTVHLGAQMKTSHNLRLISCDVFDLCRLHVTEMPSGLHVQTAISLYSYAICGLVLLVDNRLNSFSGIKREFSRVCDQSTDFHFPSLEQQMDKINFCLKDAETSKVNDHQGKPPSLSTRMNTGDFYITRHSNLSEIHVVFHLVVDDSLQGEISSRHPVIVACRNVIKTAFQNDITTLTLPLFLVHEMTEEMTIPWCLKRAELIFKCIKGFIMELPYCSFNIQFLVPQALSDETFSSLSTMMPSIFRMSNPVIAKS